VAVVAANSALPAISWVAEAISVTAVATITISSCC
jgi:hypothetical protein